MWSFLQSLRVLVLCLTSSLFLGDVVAHSVSERELQQGDVALLPDVEYMDAYGKLHKGVRCGTQHNVTSARRRLRTPTPTIAVPDTPVEIPIKFHVVANSSGLGNVSDYMILDQVRVLNDAYAGSMFHFSLNPASDILRHVDDELAIRCAKQRHRMMMKFGVGSANAMNVYTCDSELLGYSSMPDDYPEFHKLHGVLIRFDTMPGGNDGPYNLGYTLVHEVGHYLGLLHTFEGGCDKTKGGEGDGVSDTPAEKDGAKGCPIGRDTCPFSPGLDPVTNYMDYSHDSCMNHFTPGQSTRMHTETSSFRPTLYYKL